MKNILSIFLLFLSLMASAQTKNDLQEIERKKDSFDIVLPPEEQFPESVRRFTGTAQTNWGRQLFLDEATIKLMKDSCKYSVLLKIMDTGSKQNHPDLQTGQLSGANYTTDQGLNDLNGHGTHVAGIAVGKDIGILWPLVQTGKITWKPVQVLSAGGAGNFNWVTAALNAEYASDLAAIQQGKYVVWNGSLGGGTSLLPDVETPLKKAYDKGVCFVFAAGNTGIPGVQYPGKSPYGFATGSLNSNLSVSSFSSQGPEVLVAMPGGSINSTYKNNGYATLSGTSMASPFMFSAVAIARSRWGAKLADCNKLRAYMAWCASDLPPTGKDNFSGNGIIYIRNILTKDPKDMGSTPVPPNPPTTPNPPKDTLPVHALRVMNYKLDKGYGIVWNTSVSGSKVRTRKLTASRFKSADYKTLQISEIRVAYSSTTDAINSVKQINEAADWFFTNRGLMLTIKDDEYEALKWSAYFLKLLLKTEKKMEIKVLQITAKDGTFIDNP